MDHLARAFHGSRFGVHFPGELHTTPITSTKSSGSVKLATAYTVECYGSKKHFCALLYSDTLIRRTGSSKRQSSHRSLLTPAFFSPSRRSSSRRRLSLSVWRPELDRSILDEDDPRRSHIAQVLLYSGTFIVIAASVWLRHG
jgi:hypothetical protein